MDCIYSLRFFKLVPACFLQFNLETVSRFLDARERLILLLSSVTLLTQLKFARASGLVTHAQSGSFIL